MRYPGLATVLLSLCLTASAAAAAPTTVTLNLQDTEPGALAAAAAEQLGAEVHLLAPGKVSLDLKAIPADQAIEVLGRLGTLVVFHPAADTSDRQAGTCTLLAKGASPAVMSQALSALLQATVTFSADAPISLELKDVPVRAVLTILAGQGKIEVE